MRTFVLPRGGKRVSKFMHTSKAHSCGPEESVGERIAKGTSSVGVGVSPKCRGGGRKVSFGARVGALA